MMNKEILSTYMLSKMCWSNKETRPVVDIIKFEQKKEFVEVFHSVGFKREGSDKIYPYFDNIKCSLNIKDVKEYIREMNLNLLL